MFFDLINIICYSFRAWWMLKKSSINFLNNNNYFSMSSSSTGLCLYIEFLVCPYYLNKKIWGWSQVISFYFLKNINPRLYLFLLAMWLLWNRLVDVMYNCWCVGGFFEVLSNVSLVKLPKCDTGSWRKWSMTSEIFHPACSQSIGHGIST